MAKSKTILVRFGDGRHTGYSDFGVVITGKELHSYVDEGSVFEAGKFLESLPNLLTKDGRLLSQSFVYKGFDMWWLHYNSLYYYFALPYVRYKRLLEYLRDFEEVSLDNVPYTNLFVCYLESFGSRVKIISRGDRSNYLSLGFVLQLLITFLSVPILVVLRKPILVFTGDKFDKDSDYDFRLKFIYKELRERGLQFIEEIRSLEGWENIIKNAWKRGRPAVYSEAISKLASLVSLSTGQRAKARKRVEGLMPDGLSPDLRFKTRVASQYLYLINDDLLAIKIEKFIQKLIGIKAAYITAANERNYHAVLAAKLNSIPTVGILHGMSSKYSTPYDYMTGFKGARSMSVDKYGVWSVWWKEHYIKESDAYKKEQLYVSGPMRPLTDLVDNKVPGDKTQVLFVSENTVNAPEVMPYLTALVNDEALQITLKFRPYRDGFEEWLKINEPGLLEKVSSVKTSMQEAIKDAHVVVGAHSTGVLEALLQLRVPVFFETKKWGDYYGMSNREESKKFYASTPQELLKNINHWNEVPQVQLKTMREQYFGDPSRNGSKWVVDELMSVVM